MFNKASLLHQFQCLFLPKGRVQNFKGKSLKTAEQHPTSLWGRTKGDGYTTPWLKAFLSPLGLDFNHHPPASELLQPLEELPKIRREWCENSMENFVDIFHILWL